jgi:hypothetical protein
VTAHPTHDAPRAPTPEELAEVVEANRPQFAPPHGAVLEDLRPLLAQAAYREVRRSISNRLSAMHVTGPRGPATIIVVDGWEVLRAVPVLEPPHA